jgi:hypothetical protein
MSRPRIRYAAAAIALAATPTLLAEQDPTPQSIQGTPIDRSLIEVYGVLSADEIERRSRIIETGPDVGLRHWNSDHGQWAVAKTRGRLENADGNYIINTWGDTRIGIDFDAPLDVVSADLLGHGAVTPGLVVVGYLDGREVARTGRLTGLGADPATFGLNLNGVDRIEFLAEPAGNPNGGGFFGLDDLALRINGEVSVLDFEDLAPGSQLTGSGYAGITWEAGRGDLDAAVAASTPKATAIPAPVLVDEAEDAGANDERLGASRGLGTSPTLVRTFLGTRQFDAFANSFPPDTHGSIGPDHFVVVVNTAYNVYLKSTGLRIQQRALSSISPGTSGDPRVLYDQYADRWVVVSTNFNNRIYMAVSQTSDPTGAYFSFSWVASSGVDAGCFPDYPTLGLDENGYYVGAFMAGCGFALFTIDKAPLIAPSPSVPTVTDFRRLPATTLQPAHTFGDAPGAYVVSRASGSQVRHWLVTGPLTSPNLSGPFTLGIPNRVSAPDMPQLGGSPLDTLDARYINCVHRDGLTYFANCTNFAGRSAITWYVADLDSNSLVDNGTITDSVLSFNMPSIAVNKRGSIVIGMSAGSTSQYASTYFAGRIPTDPPGEMSDPVLYRAGLGALSQFDGFGRNRFGDYSYTSIDPDDDKTFYTIQEWGNTSNRWTMQIAELDLLAAPAGFQLLSPANGATEVDAQSSIGLDWEDSEDAADYLVSVFEDAGLTTPAIPPFTVGSSDASVAPGALNDGETYYWTATAQNASGSTEPSPVSFSFSTAVPTPGCVGDVTGDGNTDVFDFAELTAAFGSSPGDANWNPAADIVPNNTIDVFDFSELAADFGCMSP